MHPEEQRNPFEQIVVPPMNSVAFSSLFTSIFMFKFKFSLHLEPSKKISGENLPVSIRNIKLNTTSHRYTQSMFLPLPGLTV